ncbi:unnamed protein product, partial [Ectocarpus sp. 12 AP-2014]
MCRTPEATCCRQLSSGRRLRSLAVVDGDNKHGLLEGGGSPRSPDWRDLPVPGGRGTVLW